MLTTKKYITFLVEAFTFILASRPYIHKSGTGNNKYIPYYTFAVSYELYVWLTLAHWQAFCLNHLYTKNVIHFHNNMKNQLTVASVQTKSIVTSYISLCEYWDHLAVNYTKTENIELLKKILIKLSE